MPVTTRSQSQRPSGFPSTPEIAESNSSSKLSTKRTDYFSRKAALSNHLHISTPSKKPRRGRPTPPSPQTPRKQYRKRQGDDKREWSQAPTELSSLDFPDSIITHSACRKCPCPQGAFDPPINACMRCGHDMDEHEEWDGYWNDGCDFVCERQELVDSVIRLVLETRVVVIRSTPQVGKTTLLRLLGRRILDKHQDLEPVFIHWMPRESRDHLPYDAYLLQEKSQWQQKNATYRPNNPEARPIYLIDEAQGSYDEVDLWALTLKNRNTRRQPLFILVCLYGANGISHAREPNIESQALKMDSLQRVELRPSKPGRLFMLFKPNETDITVQKWAITNKFKLKGDVSKFLHDATHGHPGMIGLILKHFEMFFSQLPDTIRHARVWSPDLCQELIFENGELLNWLSDAGRGLWTPASESYARRCLCHPFYRGVKFSDVKSALREVATKPDGYTREPGDFDGFTFCHKMGYLHTEQTQPNPGQITFIFASPIHRRVAYRRLFPGPEPGTKSELMTLRQSCINAIERFSPSVLQNRPTQSRDSWGVPEAAFQDEVYCCLNYELHNTPILTEYAHTSDGRIDFYVFPKKWGIEVLQCGSKADIIKHAARFAPGGQYRAWNILDDFMILNFCPKSAIREIKIDAGLLDLEVQSRFLQVAVDPSNYIAEVYTHDKILSATLTLGEGRRRFYPDEYESSSKRLDTLETSQDRMMQIEQDKEDMRRQREQDKEEMRRQMEQEMKRQREQDREEMRRQREHDKEEMKQQIERDTKRVKR
ncbi:MAG: hypothetical protein Q9160_006350 [Pyrenula sp. 1 TL-2023]